MSPTAFRPKKAEIQGISKFGIGLLVGSEEFFLPFEKFPWFQKANVQQIYHLEFHHEKYLHWPDLDIDLDLDSLRFPEKYPLKYK